MITLVLLLLHLIGVTLMTKTESTTYSEAATNPLWLKAMEKELTTLNNNHIPRILAHFLQARNQ